MPEEIVRTARTKSVEQQKLDAALEEYGGEEPFYYEELLNYCSLSIDEYSDMLCLIEKSLDSYFINLGLTNPFTSCDVQDGLNDYVVNIDIHPCEEDVDYITNRMIANTLTEEGALCFRLYDLTSASIIIDDVSMCCFNDGLEI